ncbi:origin recognition complex subunit 4 C-terminus-domain-containing protein, partial [Gorgonomyces haynaldii]
MESLRELIQKTVEFGKSNSILVVGPRGSGKSELIQSVLSDIQDPFLCVRLNGFIHTDDRLALKSIIRQLKFSESGSFNSFSECLSFVLLTLKSGSQETMPIVFVLEEFDLFAQHSNQKLLYNLFDIAQSEQTPIVVIGATSRIDCLELLEKRVKSRFSHRTIHLYPMQPEDTDDDHIKNLLQVNNDKRYIELWKDNQAFDQHFQADRLELVDALSVLQLMLLIATKDVLQRQLEVFNFEMIYDTYREFCRRTANMGRGSALLFVKPVVFKAFEQMVEAGFYKYCTGISAQCPKEYRMVKSILTRQDIAHSINKYRHPCPENILKW